MKSKSGQNQIQISGQVRPRQGTEICNFGAPSPLEALHWIFCFFSSIYVQFSKTSPLKSGESSEKSSGENRDKSCHVCGCHGFFGPENQVLGKVFGGGPGQRGRCGSDGPVAPPENLDSVKVKRGRREGDGTENVTTISDTFPTIFRHFYDIPMLCSYVT